MLLTLIAAMSENRVIGRGGALPWRLPADLRRFKARTVGHTVIMGRRTFDSIGRRPLPRRRGIVVTRDASFAADGVEVAHGVDEALSMAGSCGADDEEVFVIGGGEIYAAALPRAGRLDLTIVHAEIEGDAWFPAFDAADWVLVADERHEPDDEHACAYSFRRYDRQAAATRIPRLPIRNSADPPPGS